MDEQSLAYSNLQHLQENGVTIEATLPEGRAVDRFLRSELSGSFKHAPTFVRRLSKHLLERVGRDFAVPIRVGPTAHDGRTVRVRGQIRGVCRSITAMNAEKQGLIKPYIILSQHLKLEELPGVLMHELAHVLSILEWPVESFATEHGSCFQAVTERFDLPFYDGGQPEHFPEPVNPDPFGPGVDRLDWSEEVLKGVNVSIEEISGVFTPGTPLGRLTGWARPLTELRTEGLGALIQPVLS